MMLRKVNSFPLTAGKLAASTAPARVSQAPLYDPGELEALIAEANRLGRSEEEAKRFFANEKGINPDLLM